MKIRYSNLQKSLIVASFSAAVLGAQLVQSNTVKADTTSDGTDSNTEQASDVKQDTSAIADSSSIQNNGGASSDGSVDTDDANSNNATTDPTNKVEPRATNAVVSETPKADEGDQTTTANADAAVIDGTPVDAAAAVVPNANDPIKTNVAISATNSTGTVTSTSPNTASASGATSIVNTDATSVNAVVTITNSSDEKQNDYGTLIELPGWTGTNGSKVTLSDDFDSTNFIKGLPANAKVAYKIGWNSWQTAEQLQANPNFKWSSVNQIKIDSQVYFNWIDASLEPGQSIVATIPLTSAINDGELAGASTIKLNYGGGIRENNQEPAGYLSFRFASLVTKADDWNGKYLAVTANELGKNYSVAPDDAQKIMPDYKSGDIVIDNFFHHDDGDYTKPGFFTSDVVNADQQDLMDGGWMDVHLNNLNVTKELNSNGYSFLLNPDKSQQTEYDYTTKNASPEISGMDPNSSEKVVPNVYITVRHVIDASDSTAKIGDTWTAASNLNSVQDNSDATLTGDDAINAVSTTINDSNGVLKDGKIVKAGSFTVTYTYKLNDTDLITKTVTVKVDDPATKPNNNNNSGSSSHHSGGSSNTTDPIVSPNTPDDINNQDRLVSTHPNLGYATLYKLDTTTVKNRSLKAATDWFSDRDMTFAGTKYYRVATNEWVKAASVYVYENRNIVVQTNAVQQLVDSQGNTVLNRALIADTAWKSDRIAYINGKTYYRVATNEFVPTDAVTVI